MKTSGMIQLRWFNQNLGFTDRQLRTVIGTLMITIPMFTVPETLGLWSVLILAAIPVLTTAIIGWDPLYAVLDKTTYVAHEEEIHQRHWSYANIGIIDRGLRFGVGFILLYALLTMSEMTSAMVITFIAIPSIVSAITAWDPIYALFGINSFGSRHDVEAAEPEANDKTLAACYEFPQPQANYKGFPELHKA